MRARSALVVCRKYSGGTDDRVQTAAAFVTLLRELGEDRMQKLVRSLEPYLDN